MLYNNKPTIIANWKMNPTNYKNAVDLLYNYLSIYSNLDATQINSNINCKFNLIVAPPTIYLLSLLKFLQLQNIQQNLISLSAQNFCFESKGAFTGDTSAEMIKDLGIEFSILGHSECRRYYQETDDVIAKKVMLALQANITPIICIGESQEQFSQGDIAIKDFLKQQLLVVIGKIEYLLNNFNDINKPKLNKHLFIAYEPVWAIGSGVEVDINYIQQNINYIQQIINTYLINKVDPQFKYYLLYGGSVHPSNAKEILQVKNLAGILVGGASLKVEQFAKICDSLD